MSDMYYELFWLILAVIGVAAICKVIYQFYKSRSAPSSVSGNTAITPVSNAQTHNQNETGPMVYYANNPHNRKDCEYRFNYKKVNGSWRAYILRMPDLCGRDRDLSITHRHTNGTGTYWICWDSPVNSLHDMQTISRVWANSIQEYIATGKQFK